MRCRTIILTLAAVAMSATAAVAAPAAKGPDPLKLALQRADMPPHTKQAPPWSPSPGRISADTLRFLGTGLTGAEYAYAWPAGGRVDLPGLGPTDKEWHLAGAVYVAPTPAAARTLFRDGEKAGSGFFADFGTAGASRITLPSYGDEQFGVLGTQGAKDAGGPQAMVFVRKGVVVWELRIGHSPPKWVVAGAQVLAELKRYAQKQGRRVGSG